MKMRIMTDTEWDRMAYLTEEDDQKMHYRHIFSWVHNDRFGWPGLCRGYELAGHCSTRQVNVRDMVGFRPTIEGLDGLELPFDVQIRDIIDVGTLYMNGQPVRIPKNPTCEGDIVPYVPGATLEMREPLEDPAYRVKAIYDGDKAYVDRNLLKAISYVDIQKALHNIDQPVAATKYDYPICKLLDVKIGQQFRIDYPKGVTAWLHVDEDGFVVRETGSQKIGNAIVWAINHPESIDRQPFFSAADIQFAKDLERMFPGMFKDVCVSATQPKKLRIRPVNSHQPSLEVERPDLFQNLPKDKWFSLTTIRNLEGGDRK